MQIKTLHSGSHWARTFNAEHATLIIDQAEQSMARITVSYYEIKLLIHGQLLWSYLGTKKLIEALYSDLFKWVFRQGAGYDHYDLAFKIKQFEKE